MTRKEALQRFRADHEEEKKQLSVRLAAEIEAGMEEIIRRIFQAFSEISKQAQVQKKEDCVHFIFGLQRCDLLNHQVLLRLDVMNPAWYMDDGALTTQLDLTFLFRPYFLWKEKLLLAMRSFMGKVNRYDVEHLIQEEIVAGNRLLAHPLRFAFRNLEEQECFCHIGRMPYWILRWGEYKDYSEIVMRMNREGQGEEKWLEAIEKYRENKEALTARHWYRVQIGKGEVTKKKLYFTTFEECGLTGMDFTGAQMQGVRFLRCRLERCIFANANLEGADFEDCEFQENCFREAGMLRSTFSCENFPYDDFTEEQMQGMYLVDKNRKEGQA